MSSQNGAAPTTEYLLQENAELSERLAALEFALENADWRLLTMQADQEFSRDGLRAITELARIMFLKNPLIKRAVKVQRLYVWGQGWSVKASDDEINAVLSAFLDDPKNQVELTGHQARIQKETELQTDGNLFFVFFVNQVTGRVRIRSIPFDEVQEIICNLEDAKDPWYYKRTWTQTAMMADGAIESKTMTAFYPDWRYNPTVKPDKFGAHSVRWDAPIYHVRVGGFSNWKYGVSEIYAAIDWARAYKEFLEDWASIVRAYRRFAFQLTTPGGKSGIAAAKAKLGTTYGNTGTGAETNPPPVTASTFIAGEGTSLQPVRTSGATVSAEDGRRISLMVAAATGLPETFFGDVSVGTLATATSMDRPTELAMKDRQTLWSDIHTDIFLFVLLWAVKAPQGPLRGLGMIESEVDDGEIVERLIWNEDVDPHIDIDFPPVLYEEIGRRVEAIVNAATLSGRQLAGTMDLPTLTRMLLIALGEDDVDEIVEQLFPNGEVPEQAQPSTDQGDVPERPQAEALMVAAVQELRSTLIRLQEGKHGI